MQLAASQACPSGHTQRQRPQHLRHRRSAGRRGCQQHTLHAVSAPAAGVNPPCEIELLRLLPDTGPLTESVCTAEPQALPAQPITLTEPVRCLAALLHQRQQASWRQLASPTCTWCLLVGVLEQWIPVSYRADTRYCQALNHLRKLRAEHSQSGDLLLRVGVKSGGCSGDITAQLTPYPGPS